jgi:hypothetical protein
MVNKNGRNEPRNGPLKLEDAARPIVLRLEALPATPRNLERIREQVRLLNLRLAKTGTPFRLRVM